MSNFIITNSFHIKLIDFGMSINIGDEIEKGHGGVPNYMPPERVSNHTIRFSKKQGNIKSEIYQLGLIFYYILYNKLPFTATLWKDLAKLIVNKKPFFEKKTLLDETIPQSVIDFIAKSLEKKPENRFESVEEMCEKFEKINL
jgi:eukaryotic-like serine/threonine-protein kinase